MVLFFLGLLAMSVPINKDASPLPVGVGCVWSQGVWGVHCFSQGVHWFAGEGCLETVGLLLTKWLWIGSISTFNCGALDVHAG